MLDLPLTATTHPIYLQDDHCFESDARLLVVSEQALAFDQTCFYPGGGGQPADLGSDRFNLRSIKTIRFEGGRGAWRRVREPALS